VSNGDNLVVWYRCLVYIIAVVVLSASKRAGEVVVQNIHVFETVSKADVDKTGGGKAAFLISPEMELMPPGARHICRPCESSSSLTPLLCVVAQRHALRMGTQ
jgi:hypothetical protein